MSVSQEQLSQIYRQLREHFLSIPVISIKPIKGDPPERYEITYNISGFIRPGKSQPSLTPGHKIELTIPFGFPHFPPSCKPKSEIFHPDFDPAAICLGDFWQQQTQIPDLIIFIGKLINGESYSKTNAFNEDAATWYQSHADLFPIADIKWDDNEKDSSKTLGNFKPQVDTIDDADLSPDFNFLAIEGTSPNEDHNSNTPLPATEEVPSGTDLGLLQLLESQRKFFKLRLTLRQSTTFSDQIEKISAHTEEEIKKAEELHRAAKKTEKLENFINASRLYEQVGAIAVDFPNLEADQKRVCQFLSVPNKNGNFTPTPEVSALDFPDQSENELPGPDIAPKSSIKRPAQATPAKQRQSFLIENPIGKKLVFSLLAIVLTVILAAGGFYYFNGLRQLDASKAAFEQCTVLFGKEQFDGAKNSCNIALESLSLVKLIQQDRVNSLKSSINEILVSEKLVQGIAGNVLVDGKYLPKKDAAIVLSSRQLRKEAEEFFAQENWTQTEDRLNKALAIAEKNTLFSPADVEEMKSKLNFTRFSMVFSTANTLLEKQKWQEAATEIKKAKTLLESLPEKDRQRYAVELSSALAKCNFEEFRKQGDDFFSKADWLNAISSYKSVLPAVEEDKVASQETISALRENISRAELYATIDMGNKAFISGSWDEAIKEYNKASSILSANQGTMKVADSQLTRKKIDRIILQTTIIRDRQAAKIQQEAQKDLIAARNTHRQIVANITNSGFAAEDEFRETKKTSTATIQALEEKIYHAEKEQYLKDNFRTIFAANYPAAIPENLNNPAANYIKEADGKMIFKIQCTETGAGRPLTLIMFYAYDKTNNRWDFFSEQQ